MRAHTTGRPDRSARPNGSFRPASPARAVIDAARFCTGAGQVRAAVAEAVQSRHCTPDELVRELAAAHRGGSKSLRDAVAEVVDGVRSVAEGEARTLLARSRVLPAMLWNPRLEAPTGEALPTPDGRLADVDVGIEVDSRAFHFSVAGWERTMRRHARLTQFGALILHVSPGPVRADGAAFGRTVEAAYRQRREAGYRSRIRVADTATAGPP